MGECIAKLESSLQQAYRCVDNFDYNFGDCDEQYDKVMHDTAESDKDRPGYRNFHGNRHPALDMVERSRKYFDEDKLAVTDSEKTKDLIMHGKAKDMIMYVLEMVQEAKSFCGR